MPALVKIALRSAGALRHLPAGTIDRHRGHARLLASARITAELCTGEIQQGWNALRAVAEHTAGMLTLYRLKEVQQPLTPFPP
jgi:hypothetical protein